MTFVSKTNTKKMKKTIITFALAFIFNIGCYIAQDYKVNTDKSTIHWIGKKVTGEHDGFISIKEGQFYIVNNQITRGQFYIDMSSMTCTDIEDATYNQKLVGHLKSADFFGVENYPTAKLIITKSTPFKDNQCVLHGNLTIKDKTDVVQFIVKRNNDVYKAKINVDRSKYDVKYGSSSFFDNLGDKVIYDIFELEVKLILN